MKKIRLMAFYLPQFHPIPENNEWWGKGFTEWTNVGKAKSLFRGHYQPRVPADLGYYDLRVSETREAQTELAKKAGIEGFVYWHYWFNGSGKQLLEMPFNEVLKSGKPDFPFCLAWANETWEGYWHGMEDNKVFIKQSYDGIEDYTKHFYSVLQAFLDKRYITVEGRPLFFIYHPLASRQIIEFIKTWRKLANQNKIEDIYFVGISDGGQDEIELYKEYGLDAMNVRPQTLRGAEHRTFFEKTRNKIFRIINKCPNIGVDTFSHASKYFFDVSIISKPNMIPTILSGWDHSPRTGLRANVLTQFEPHIFKEHVEFVLSNTNPTPGIVIVKSWNEWGEGNYLEPDIKYGHQFINVLHYCVEKHCENGDIS